MLAPIICFCFRLPWNAVTPTKAVASSSPRLWTPPSWSSLRLAPLRWTLSWPSTSSGRNWCPAVGTSCHLLGPHKSWHRPSPWHKPWVHLCAWFLPPSPLLSVTLSTLGYWVTLANPHATCTSNLKTNPLQAHSSNKIKSKNFKNHINNLTY